MFGNGTIAKQRTAQALIIGVIVLVAIVALHTASVVVIARIICSIGIKGAPLAAALNTPGAASAIILATDFGLGCGCSLGCDCGRVWGLGCDCGRVWGLGCEVGRRPGRPRATDEDIDVTAAEVLLRILLPIDDPEGPQDRPKPRLPKFSPLILM